MNQTDTEYRRAFLYLRVAGFDAGPGTHARLKHLAHQSIPARSQSPDQQSLLRAVHDQFSLNPATPLTRPPAIARGHIGYGRD